MHNAFTVLLDPGDEVIIPAPYWVSYAELVKLTGAMPAIVPTRQQDDFKLTPGQFRQATGAQDEDVAPVQSVEPDRQHVLAGGTRRLADVVVEKNLLVVADEIYERLVYGEHRFASFATVRPGLAERTVLVSGVSKTYAMTGWRIGWTLAPPEVSRAMADLQSQETSNPCSISQYAALAALNGPQDCVAQMLAEFAKRRQFVPDAWRPSRA